MGLDAPQIIKKVYDATNNALRMIGAVSLQALISAASVAVDMSTGTIFRIVLGHNVTFTFSNPTSGQKYSFILRQDGTGSRTVTWPANVKWGGGGTPPTLTTTATTGVDVVSMIYDGTSDVFLADKVLNFA